MYTLLDNITVTIFCAKTLLTADFKNAVIYLLLSHVALNAVTL